MPIPAADSLFPAAEPMPGDRSMHIAYIDESGDLGGARSPTRHFILCAVVVRHDRWEDAREELTTLRQRLLKLYRLHPAAEIHAKQFLGGDARHRGLEIRARFQCAHHILQFLRQSRRMSFVRQAVRKDGAMGAQVLAAAWQELAKELVRRTGAATFACNGRGWVLVADHHGDQPYRDLAMNRFLQTEGQPLLEHPFGRRSHDCEFLQIADLLAFLTKQTLEPNHHFSTSLGRHLTQECLHLFGAACPISGC